ncbi:HAD family phosphatase [Luteipulveratus sp. YIM 133132]|uniref:HAD family hydrolase n=1 Tax=Luteipulveratus flavus TaxID=3031728 RepID=UPI0023AE9737|nr:HAD family phosphatase [Luteipulveratus sp. YIM 133132]MDE9366523.1 HAD family phosphatase [Luteipulveratus sp. YIM 133132]
MAHRTTAPTAVDRAAGAGERLPAAVLWDMDGTIVDTEPFWIAEEHDLVESYGGRWTDELAHECVGNPLLVSAQIIRDNSPVTLEPHEIVERLLSGVVRRMREHVPWRPGAQDLLRALAAQDVPCALVTMSYASFAQVLIDAVPGGTFVEVITGDSVTHGKPHPEPYLAAAAALGVQPADCVAIEDSPPGVRSAVAAGVPTLAVPHVVAVPAIEGAVQIDTLAGLTPSDLVRLSHAR